MAFLENIGKKVSEAAQAAAKKSSELVEIGKININISSEEDRIQKLYEQIGRKIYGYFASGEEVPDELKNMCLEIQSREKTIKGLKQKILEIKNIKLCEQCGAEVEKTDIFCPKCGTKQTL